MTDPMTNAPLSEAAVWKARAEAAEAAHRDAENEIDRLVYECSAAVLSDDVLRRIKAIEAQRDALRQECYEWKAFATVIAILGGLVVIMLIWGATQ